MADMMQFDLVSPERRLASLQVREVRIPGVDGELTAMPGHAPLITTLRPGVLAVAGAEGETDYVVTGGFAEVTATGVSVLAEVAHPTKNVTQAMIDDMVAEAHRLHKEAGPDLVDAAAKTLADMVALGGRIGLEPKLP
ncbi:F0F1 ATP synthase subunit epsilon [Frigidibacter sp. SD6-1]|uniref:F0F1 ATP synthase subunit epsilon n=1 Tax=Frigidibacter sp. SD6-1 TaxID=3032581 RepID=UPI0024DF7627|nr:F0F1 ATP synthase subunit epsilon [Frigidibacter sp. SD6-1]